jgi:hypothetical protein
MPLFSHSRRRRMAEWWREVHWYFVGALALAALVLGIIGFHQWYATHGVTGTTFWDAFYKGLQLFTLESGSADAPVPAMLDAARFMALVAALYGAGAAVLAVFGERLARLRLRRAKGHAVVCGLGDRGLHLAERLLDQGRRVAVIDRDQQAPFLDRVQMAGATAVVGDASSSGTLAKARAHRAAQVFAVCPDDGTNAEIAVRLMELARAEKPKPPVTVVAHIGDTELCRLLREQAALGDGVPGVVLRFFSVPESGAQAMLGAVPPAALHEGGTPHIVVIGLGKLGRSLVAGAARAWRQTRPPGLALPRVTMIDQSAEAKAALLRLRFPEIETVCTLLPLTMPKNDPELERGAYLCDPTGRLDVDAVYVCPDDDVHSLAAALIVQRHTRQAAVPIAVRMTRRGGLATLLEGRAGSAFARLHAVSMLESTCDPQSLVGDQVPARA